MEDGAVSAESCDEVDFVMERCRGRGGGVYRERKPRVYSGRDVRFEDEGKGWVGRTEMAFVALLVTGAQG